jgi:hypothetical protein
VTVVAQHRFAEVREMYAAWPSLLPLMPTPDAPKGIPKAGFTGYNGKDPTEDDYRLWADCWPQTFGLRMPDGSLGIDVDQYGDKTGWDTIQEECRAAGAVFPAHYKSSRRGPGPSGIYVVRVPLGRKFFDLKYVEFIQPHHRFAVVAPSVVDGLEYRWYDTDDEVLAIPPTPEDLPWLPDALVERWSVRPPKGPTTWIRPDGGFDVPELVEKALHDILYQRDEARHNRAKFWVCELVRAGANDEAVGLVRQAHMGRCDGDGDRGKRDPGFEFDDLYRWATENIRPDLRRLMSAETRAQLDGHAPETAQSGPQDEPAPAEPSSWSPIDLGPALAGEDTRPVPTLLLRSDGAGLFYAGRVNAVWGESGAGKGWVTLALVAQEIHAGRAVIYIDLEDDELGTVARLRKLGVGPDAIGRLFIYLRPADRLDRPARGAVDALIGQHNPSVLVIDSVGELMALDGVKPNDDDGVALWHRWGPRHWADLGPAVECLDHVTKDREGRGLYAIGSQRKRAAITGHAVMVEQVKPFGEGADGLARITTAKDRHGRFRRGLVVAEFRMDETAGLVVSLDPPTGPKAADGRFRPTVLMEKMSRVLELKPAGCSKNSLRIETPGDNKAKQQGIEILVEEGYFALTLEANRTHWLKSVRPYREADDR